MPRPSPHMTFSLSSGKSVAPSRSNTTRRSELEPMSITAIRPKETGVLRSGIGAPVTSSRDQPRLTPTQSPAPARQAGVCHEVGVGRELLVYRCAGIGAVSGQHPALQRVAQV